MKNYFFVLLSTIIFLCAIPPKVRGAKTTAPPSTEMLLSDHRIIELTDKYLALLNTIYPEDAARAGALGYQSTLDPRDKQSESIKRETIIALQNALNNVDYKKLSPLKEIDYQVLRSLVNKKVFDIQVYNRIAKNPLWYLETVDGVYDILIKDYKPYQERLSDAMKRLQGLPAVLEQAKQNLNNPPDLYLRIALERTGAAYNSFNALSTLMNRMAQDDYTKGQIKVISSEAQKAVKSYFDFLKNTADDKDYVDFRLGADNLSHLLNGVYFVNMSLKKIDSVLTKEFETSKKNLIFALTAVLEPTLSQEDREKRTNKKGVIEIYPSDYYIAAAAYNKTPNQKDILNTFLNYFNESEEFFKNNKIFPKSSLKLLISPAPKYLQQEYKNAVYLPPFPLLSRQFGDLLVAVPDSKEAPAVLPKLFTFSEIKISAVENLSAGANLLFSYSNDFLGNALKLSNDPFYIKGWIKYSLNLAKEKNYLIQDEDLIHIAWHNYKTAALALAGLQMHSGKINYTSALEQLVAAGINKEEAAAGLDLVALNPVEYLSSILGEQEFSRLSAKYQKKLGSKFNLEDFHNKVLSTGRVPITIVERALSQAYEKKTVDSFFNTLYF
ncbi:MAG: DUF885 domain-containing protein [Elusimicrobiota bacterium]|jgi:hypothetical protein|nr:DUF885 domain-containing protein [Elusimicrobiota bacterium]